MFNSLDSISQRIQEAQIEEEERAAEGETTDTDAQNNTGAGGDKVISIPKPVDIRINTAAEDAAVVIERGLSTKQIASNKTNYPQENALVISHGDE
jgi:hypothetical protein